MSDYNNNDYNEQTDGMNASYVESPPASRWKKFLYTDSTSKAILLFIGVCTLNAISVFPFELGYWYFVEPIGGHLPSIVNLLFYLVFAVFLIVYTIMCCRKRLVKQLTGITTAFGVIALGTIITSGIFFPIFNALSLVLCYITNRPDHESGVTVLIAYILNFVAVILSTFLTGYAINHERTRHRLSLSKITVIMSVVSLAFLVLYGFAYAKYEYQWVSEEYYAESSEDSYNSVITAEQRKLYSDIKIGDNAEKTQQTLTEKGFVKKDKSYEDFIWGCYYPYYVDGYLEEKNPEKTNGSNYAIYCYAHEMEDHENWDDVISCIVFSHDQNGKINYKLFIPDANSLSMDGYYMNYTHGEKTQKWYNNINIGDDSESALKFIRSTGATIFEDEKYVNGVKENTYKIILQCYYPYEPQFVEFLFGISPDDELYFYDFEITAQNGKITEKQMSDMW